MGATAPKEVPNVGAVLATGAPNVLPNVGAVEVAPNVEPKLLNAGAEVVGAWAPNAVPKPVAEERRKQFNEI